ncbi:hypothetical protein A2634_01905 [Candidatus Amesbacteria bacterium RIFCSPHIGHO2_01_FULL_48_32]|uniref:Uncharacterized protein n=1 Tax=Candidatus Amesbacteria bacterium RIFCSPLOWO2_01_FULL_48_25 TaxID=1797259 RepID=A0A1F4ZFX4_9BACT|nr:MAG: hypothetical protein A2634_01905 [Candidatus Amesbacteria bacterium RIFCSPHIGHO2_01_FULL_48_32]OGD04344.1 MAG: hypothetical protein A2989_04905 [Candidatus Amesbacteria bacterium RIFCSPLOWO2_01_FULL_48_25]HJZ06179.1 hypothetical protein [Patescibacteria group bacterium]
MKEAKLKRKSVEELETYIGIVETQPVEGARDPEKRWVALCVAALRAKIVWIKKMVGKGVEGRGII